VTPFELSLRNELDVERQRFGNEWLFKWHSLNIEGRTVDVDRFDGGRICVGGLVFEDQLQSIYWQAIGRYLNSKVHQETRSYPVGSRRSSLDGTERVLWEFVANVVRHATETDQALRGRGYPKKDAPRDGSAAHTGANVDIHRLAEAYRALLPVEEEISKATALSRIGSSIGLKPSLWGISIDLKKLFGWGK
jgi:hypothetical protein